MKRFVGFGSDSFEKLTQNIELTSTNTFICWSIWLQCQRNGISERNTKKRNILRLQKKNSVK